MPVSPKPDRYPSRPYTATPSNIDDEMIRAVVYRFYDHARADPVIGPVFKRRVADWPGHLEKMVDFWSSGILRTGRYRGRPTLAHKRIDEIRPEHFHRWLELFDQTVHEFCPPREAAVFMDLAQRMGRAMMTMLRLDPQAEDRAATGPHRETV